MDLLYDKEDTYVIFYYLTDKTELARFIDSNFVVCCIYTDLSLSFSLNYNVLNCDTNFAC